MGAEGYVRVMDADKFRAAHAAMWPGHDLDQDFPYMKTLTGRIGGKDYVLDYWDSEDHSSILDIYAYDLKSKKDDDYEYGFANVAAKRRVVATLDKARRECAECTVEVWT